LKKEITELRHETQNVDKQNRQESDAPDKITQQVMSKDMAMHIKNSKG